MDPEIVIRDIHIYGDDLTVPQAIARLCTGGPVTITATDPAPPGGDPRGNPRLGYSIEILPVRTTPCLTRHSSSFDTPSRVERCGGNFPRSPSCKVLSTARTILFRACGLGKGCTCARAADTNITVANIQVNGAGTQATAEVTIAAGAGVGAGAVRITTPSGVSTAIGTGGNIFTVQ